MSTNFTSMAPIMTSFEDFLRMVLDSKHALNNTARNKRGYSSK